MLPRRSGRVSHPVVTFFVPLLLLGSFSAALYAQRFVHADHLYFTKSSGGAVPLPQVLAVVGAGADLTFSASATTSSGGDWLSVSTADDCCGTPAPVHVAVKAGDTLAAGSYTGEVMLTGGDTPQVVKVTLVVVPPGTAMFDKTPSQIGFFMKP